jgi:hypothetical protein
MGIFDRVNEAESTRGGYYFEEGKYRVRLQRVFKKTTRKGIEMMIIETEILESTNPGRPVGTKPSVLYGDDKDATAGNIKGFFGVAFAATQCLAGTPMTPTEAEKEFLTADSKDAAAVKAVKERCDEAVGDDNPLAGLELSVEAFPIKTRAGNDFTKIVWSVPADVFASAKAA